MSDGRETRRRNLIAGYVSLGLIAALIAAIALVAIVHGLREGPKPYVMYVSNSGTIGPGDPVYMNGRHIGEVTESQLVRRDGEVITRVNFMVFERYGGLEFPVNSVAAISAPGFASGPRLELSMGSSAESIERDGEFAHTSPASATDVFTELGAQAKSADRQIQAIIELLDDQEMIADIQQFLVEFRDSVDEMAGRIKESEPGLLAAVERLKGAPAEVDEVREALRTNSEEMEKGLRRMSAALADTDRDIAEFQSSARETMAAVRDYQKSTARAAEMSRDPALRGLFLDARWASAELAAMAERAVGNPAAFGDAPGFRRASRKFNGGETALSPFGDETEVNETE